MPMETKKQTSVLKNVLFIILLSQIYNINAQSNSDVIFKEWYRTKKTSSVQGYPVKGGKAVFDWELDFPKIDGKRTDFEAVIGISDKFYFFTSLYNNNNETYSAYANEIYLDGKLNPQSIKIDEISNVTNKNKGYFVFNLSLDGTSILAYHAHDVEIGDKKIGKIIYKTLNKDLVATPSNQIEMPRSFDYCSAIKWTLIDSQNLVYLEKDYTKVEGEKDLIIKSNICLYNSKEKKMYKTAIMAHEKYILDVTIEMSSNGQLFCSGIYCIDRSFGGSWDGIRCLKGVFYYLFDKNNLEVISHNEKDIQAALANDKLYRFHMTSSSVSNEKASITCQFQHQILTSGVGHDNTYQKIFGQYIYTVFDLKNKANTILNVSEK